MKASEIVFDKNISNRDKFGVYLKEKRLELGMSVRYFAALLEVSPAYISDIENGNRVAPSNYLNKMIEILKIDEKDLEFFYDLAGCSKSNWPEINEYLGKTPNARKFLRLAKAKGLSDEEVSSMILSTIEDSNSQEL